ncbi:MAG: IS66 family insertion sequence element accessory protein TnpB [Saprospiraceae bacterium]|nr:IS66 family insertion sequence element accessory protein TnpB [Saprospiraceae bacterium]
MLSLNAHHRYYVYCQAADMRKGFDGLSGLVRQHFEADLMSGDVFIFMNRRRDRIKLLMWDSSGFAIYYKRLERGTFELPLGTSDQRSLELSWSDLVMLLEGIELRSVRRRKRYMKSA